MIGIILLSVRTEFANQKEIVHQYFLNALVKKINAMVTVGLTLQKNVFCALGVLLSDV